MPVHVVVAHDTLGKCVAVREVRLCFFSSALYAHRVVECSCIAENVFEPVWLALHFHGVAVPKFNLLACDLRPPAVF